MPPPEIQRNLQPINLFNDRNKNEDINKFQDEQYEVGREDLTQSGNIHAEGNETLQHEEDDVGSEDSTESGNDYGDECSTVSDNPSFKSNETGLTKEADAASLLSDDAGSLFTDETTQCNPSWFDRGFKNIIDAIDEGCTFVPMNEECGDDDSTNSRTMVEEDLREHYKEYRSSSRGRSSRESVHSRSPRYWRHLERTRRARKSRCHEGSLSPCPTDGTDSHCSTEGTEGTKEKDCPTEATDNDDVGTVERRSTVDTRNTIETRGTVESRSTVGSRSTLESRSFPPDTDTSFDDKNLLAGKTSLSPPAYSPTEQADTKKKGVAGRGGGSSKRIAMISSLKHNPFRLKRG
jgi:hypothetical protein